MINLTSELKNKVNSFEKRISKKYLGNSTYYVAYNRICFYLSNCSNIVEKSDTKERIKNYNNAIKRFCNRNSITIEDYKWITTL
jgi:hypothetical protein